jgi:hypothetical protein
MMSSKKPSGNSKQIESYERWWGNTKNVPKRTIKDTEKWWRNVGNVLHSELYSTEPPTWETVTLTPHQLLYLLNTHRDVIRNMDELQLKHEANIERMQGIMAAFDHWCANSDEHTSNRA